MDIPSAQTLLQKTDIQFIQNKGQFSKEILFSTFPGNVFIFKNRVTVNGIAIQFKNTNPHLKIRGIDQNEARFNYFKGNNSSKWKRDVPSYSKVLFKEIYHGIDLIFTGLKNGKIEFQWIIKPYAEPEKIRFEIECAEVDVKRNFIKIKKEGIVSFEIVNLKAYQGADEIEVSFIQKGSEIIYKIGKYQKKYTLIIDPDLDQLLASTYLGGSAEERVGYSSAFDNSGNILLLGYTSLSNFPIVGGYDTDYNGGTYDVFVAKFNPDLNNLLASTYLGGSSEEQGYGISSDNSGNVFISGYTYSSDFPIVGGYDPSYNGGTYDVFAAKMNYTHLGEEDENFDAPDTTFLKENKIKIFKTHSIIKIIFEIQKPSYIGINVYKADGSIIRKVSCGFKDHGIYKIEIHKSDFQKGIYLIKARVGKKLKSIRLIAF